jgi:hypothetical protein
MLYVRAGHGLNLADFTGYLAPPPPAAVLDAVGWVEITRSGMGERQFPDGLFDGEFLPETLVFGLQSIGKQLQAVAFVVRA